MLVNRDFLGRSVRSGVPRWLLLLARRWLPLVAHTPVRHRALVAATALTAAAAVASAGSATAPAKTRPDRMITVPAAGAGLSSTAEAAPAEAPPADSPPAEAAPTAAAPAEPGGAAGWASGFSAADRTAKIAAAREKATKAKAERARALAPGRGGPEATGPSSAASGTAKEASKANEADKVRKTPDDERTPPPSDSQLMPHGTPDWQSAFAPSREQVHNAKKIVKTGERLNLPPRAQVIAVATALQESKLENLGHLGALNDHDSLGLFQQRPSVGWGTPEQVTDPDYSAEQFYRVLASIPGYQDLPLTVAAQTVQVSAFPDAYAQWEKMAADLVLATHGTGPYAGIENGQD